MSGSSQGADPKSMLCRYFANGCCRLGERCTFAHDRALKSDMVCKFFLQGSCGYGSACRYDHIKPKQTCERDRKSMPSVKKTTGLPKPMQLPKPGMNVEAAEFVPSWKKLQPGSSYSMAAGANSETPDRSGAIIPLCPYFEMGECLNENCQFVHGIVCEMCFRACLHPDDDRQQRDHFNECLAGHEAAMEEAFAEAKSADKICGICMENIREKDLRFGILEGCRHCFCLKCIREWRRNQGFETNVVRSCPECRQHSDYVIPSVLWVEEDNEKAVLIEIYKENTKKKLCKYYAVGSSTRCPFGNKCFYKHQLPDGSIDPGEAPHLSKRRVLLSEFLFREEDEPVDFAMDFEMDDDEMMDRIFEELRRLRGLL